MREAVRVNTVIARGARSGEDAAGESLGVDSQRLTGPAADAARERLIIKVPGHLIFLALDEIDWIESAGNYVHIHAGAETHTTRESIKNLEARLDGRFLRVHRSAVVNTGRIRRISTDDTGHHHVVLKDGTSLAAGRYLEGPLREWMDRAC